MELAILLIKKIFMTASEADFTYCREIDDNEWRAMQTNPANTSWGSPTSLTDYVLTMDFNLYRRSKKWGAVGSCKWKLFEMGISKWKNEKLGGTWKIEITEPLSHTPLVGVCNLADFNISSLKSTLNDIIQ